MEYRIRLADPKLHLATVQDVLLELDPAAFADHDPVDCVLRVTTWAQAGELQAALTAAGLEVDAIELQPSVCCGDCSG